MNTKFLISTITDKRNHFAVTGLYCKLDCSQACHCVHSADDLLVEFLTFIFASRTFAYNCSAQRLNKSGTGFSSLLRYNHDSCLGFNVCTQFMGDFAVGNNVFEDSLPAQRRTFVVWENLLSSFSHTNLGSERQKLCTSVAENTWIILAQL